MSVLRLFIAINLDGAMTDYLLKLQKEIVSSQKNFSGRLVGKENLHLTLAFIGETSRVEDVKKVLGETVFSPFDINLDYVGEFKKTGVIYVSVKGGGLFPLAGDISSRLTKAGFTLEERKYTPHITLIKRTEAVGILPQIKLPPVMTVREIALKKSGYMGGRLVYTDIFKQRSL